MVDPKAPRESSSTWIWDRYWQFDRIASCFDNAGANNYHESVAGGWRRFFETLPTDSSILDVCTGNGAIALLAAETSRAQGKRFQITGIDRASIDPKRYVSRASSTIREIRFLGNTAAEKLPFADSSFKAVVSNYGLEYTDLPNSAAEVMRVLEPGGHIRLVVHAEEGSVAEGAADVVRDADKLLRDIALVDLAAKAIVAVCAVERGDDPSEAQKCEADAAFSNFERALNLAVDFSEEASDRVMVRNSAAVLWDTFQKRAYFSPSILLAKVEEVGTEIEAHRERSAALLEAAISAEEARKLLERLQSLGGSELSCMPLMAESRLIGHVIEGVHHSTS